MPDVIAEVLLKFLLRYRKKINERSYLAPISMRKPVGKAFGKASMGTNLENKSN